MIKVALIAPACFAITNELEYGGTEVCVLNLCEELKTYCEVTLFAPRGSHLRDVNVVETVEPENAWGQDGAAFEVYKGMLSEFDIVHSNEHHMLAYRCKQDHLKMCHTLHGIQTLPSLRPVPEPNLIALSLYHEKECQKRYGGSYRIIPHGIDLNRYEYVGRKQDYILHFGLIAQHKGHDVTFDLVRRTGARVVIAGEDRFVADSGYVEFVKNTSRELGIEYLGPMTFDEKVKLMQAAKAILLPFHVGEAFSLITVEALSCGTPVICSNIGAMPEILSDGYDGFLCNDIDDFVRAFESIDGTKPLSCRIKAETEFGRELMAQRHLALYQDIIRGEQW